jgi:hypothetical protein
MLRLFLISYSGSCLLALANLMNMPPLGKLILLSFSNLVIIVVNSPMNKLIAFYTHFSFVCMITGVSTIAIHSASIADVQQYDAIKLGHINYPIRSINGVKH